MEYTQSIRKAIDEGKRLFVGFDAGFGKFYPVDEDTPTPKVAKIFRRPHHAKNEYDMLLTIRALLPIVHVPIPYALIELSGLPHIFDDKEFNGTGHAVVMERIHGRRLCDVAMGEQQQYHGALLALLENMDQHGLARTDIKSEDIICMQDSRDVVLVDTHTIHRAKHRIPPKYVFEYLTAG